MTTFRSFPALTEAWRERVPGERLRRVRRAGEEVRGQLLSEGTVLGLRTCSLITFPYPALFAFSGGAKSPAPYVMMTNRMMVVQFEDPQGERKILLFNPSDFERGVNAPFYAVLRQKYGNFLSDKVMSTRYGTVQEHLARLGLEPGDVDYIAFDHLHVQDVRQWVGGEGASAYFPRAKLLVQRAEWEGAQNLHPMQMSWYVPNGIAGVPMERVVLLEGDAWLGRGVAILSTPGHTLGNMSLAVVTDNGVFVTSENGVAVESYTPLQSRIPGVRGYAEQYGAEVVLNGNTREHSLDQYTSMVLEKTVAGPSRADPQFVNFLPSSELTASIFSPGLTPTFTHGEIHSGTISIKRGAKAA
jgi:glyoxylase-like metal-dependent hydrolase (beta-lactamase superfamily II)